MCWKEEKKNHYREGVVRNSYTDCKLHGFGDGAE